MGKPEGGGGPGEKNENLKNYKTVKVVEIEKTSIIEVEKKKAPEGWLTKKGIAMLVETSEWLVQKIAEPFRATHPQWFKEYSDRRNHLLEHYHPDLISLIKQSLKERGELAPAGWMTNGGLAKSLGVNYKLVKNIADSFKPTYPESFKEYVDTSGNLFIHFSPNLVAMIKQKIKERGESAPEGWVTAGGLAVRLDIGSPFIQKIAEPFRSTHPQWFKEFLDKAKNISEHYSPDLVTIVEQTIRERGESAPEGWVTNGGLAVLLRVSSGFIEKIAEPFRSTHPQWFKKFLNKNKLFEYYHPNLVMIVRQRIKERGELAPEGWETKPRMAELLDVSHHLIKQVVEPFRITHPEWFKEYSDTTKRLAEYYHPDLVVLIKQSLKEIGEPAPAGWMTNGGLAASLKVSFGLVEKTVEPFRSTHPQWFKNHRDKSGHTNEHYHPDLIAKIKAEVVVLKRDRAEQEKRNQDQKNLDEFVKTIGEGKTPIAQQFQSLTRIFGSSHCLDLLYKFRPEYKGLPTDYVKGVLADYLGDFLVTKGDFKPNDVEMAVEYLSDLTFQEGLYETIKDNCLRYYFDQKRTGKKNSQEIIYGYLDHLLKELGHLNSKALDDIVQKVIIYYDSVLRDFHKPPQFVEALSNDREFPDINQRINMKELSDKKRLLIADEMGLGKSASVIMAKEQLGVRCALVVAPSNVLDTWENYLSDENEGGYYKAGQAPKILRVENPEDLKDAHSYSYILISQERLNERHTEHLKKIDYDMLVVDEAHKLKGLEGARTQELLPLAARIEGENKYLALLSGTPVPNKIEDLAFILRLLYPDKFTNFSDSELVYQIIYGDIVDLRSLLLPRMQMKSLEEGVEMPDLSESTIPVELSSAEKEAYEVLLEEDELTASEKMVLLRKFLLNSDAIDATPGIESSKIKELDTLLAEAFKKGDKVAVFVNDYMEDIIRGNTDIIRKLHLPPDVVVRTIHGEILQKEREKIQLEFNESSARILLVVSGQTADVGVDLSGGEHVIFYNEPWTEYQKRQELARVYRPGLAQGLKSETLVAKGTIEQGIHEYIQRKYQAVEKLLRGIPITELEKELISKDEKAKEPDRSVNPELAAYYFSSWDKLMRIFGYVKEIGEENFKKFLNEYAGDYANCYQDLGGRSYQANANRVAGTLINEMVKAKEVSPKTLKILDLASGPEMLKQHVEEKYQEQVFSLDINREHFTKREKGKQVVGSLLALPFAGEAFDFANLSLSLHYTNFAPSRGKLERLQVLMETNRVLKVGGRAVIGLIYSFVLKDTEKFREAIEPLGFRLVDEYSGEAVAGDRYQSHIVTLEKVKSLDPAIGVDEMNEQLGKEKSDGLKFEKSETKLKDSRRIITSFELAGKKKQIQLNQEDQLVWQDEQQAVGQGEFLKKKYGSIENIPRESIITNNFVRLRIDEKNKKYILFKKLAKNSGVVVVK